MLTIALSIAARAAPVLDYNLAIKLESELGEFDKSLRKVESHTEELRRRVIAHRKVEAKETAQIILEALRELANRWRNVEALYKELRSKTNSRSSPLPLVREGFPLLTTYLNLKSLSDDDDERMTMLMRSWVGLRYGEKFARIPEGLFIVRSYGNAKLHAGDPAILHLINGGLVRGQILGWQSNSNIVMHELLPVGLSATQRNGMFRVIEPKHIARIELFPRPETSRGARGIAPTLLDRKGNYLPGVLPSVLARRIDLQQDNQTIFNMVRKEEWNNFPDYPLVALVETSAKRAEFSELPFDNCFTYLNDTRL